MNNIPLQYTYPDPSCQEPEPCYYSDCEGEICGETGKACKVFEGKKCLDYYSISEYEKDCWEDELDMRRKYGER